jgi:hypothetical protein
MASFPMTESTATGAGLDSALPKVEAVRKLVYKEFAATHLRSRIVQVMIKKRKKGTKVYLTWHPKKVKDVAKDTFVIVKTVNKVIPDFHSISLKALEPSSLRWTKRVFWDAVITRKDLHLIKNKADTGSDDPRPLFY